MAASLSPKIQDLVARLNRDPDSKIFLQLAEEYRKEGLLEEALLVCKGGLKKHPGYQSARVALGRIFLSLKRLEEARAEFEVVLRASPDNLLANRLLGDLLAQIGEPAAALERYRAVQMYGPSDPDIAVKMQALEAKQAPAAPSPEPAAAPSPPQAAGAQAPSKAPAAAAAKSASGAAPGQPSSPSSASPPAAMPASPPPPAAPASEPQASAVAPAPEPPAAPELPPKPEPVSVSEPTPAGHLGPPVQTQAATSSPPAPDTSGAARGVAPPPAGGLKKPRDGINTQTLAELYVRQGFVDRAVDVYRRILGHDPNNRNIQERLRELEPMVLKKEPPSVVSPPVGEPQRGSVGSGPPDGAAAIARLERWLKAIQGGGS